ncbi:hypothetical protein KIN20_027319 [Parelaphostrongylus tenuis]|uniref:Uncharacterized protein n=1 Tax=Parelaphostrongylus tenuis TaxID=148309 RepID=A0AAD5QZ64_PARTN|nr:hypothetical protein KIN20_027319 [Parelaphostrongylus tenuis]
MLFANIRELAFKSRHATQSDWEAFEDEELETVLQGLALSADEALITNKKRTWTKNVHTPEGSQHDDDGTDDAQ